MKIGIDIDGVIADFVGGFLDFSNKKFGYNHSMEDWKTYDLWDFLPFSKEEGKRLMEEFYEEGWIDDLNLIEGSKEAIINLLAENEIKLITARPLRWKKGTEVFINKHFSEFSIEVLHARAPDDSWINKSTICNEKEIEIMIEDNGKYALDCAENGIRVILLNTPYNQEEIHENIIRADNWDNILEKIKEIEK